MATHISLKYAPITKEDKAPMGHIVKVTINDKESYYIQVSPQENEPEWLTIQEFLGEVFGNLVEYKQFVDESLRIYHNKKNNPLFNIIKIMSELHKELS